MASEIKLYANEYPGRGIIIGMTPDGGDFVQIYWIMGRSDNSRNRVFVAEGDSVRTKAHIESKLTDPSLVIYYPVRIFKNAHIVTNGDQTDTICDFMAAGKTFEEALLTRQYEPDPPNCTPRISGVLHYEGEASHYALSILKTVDNNEDIQNKSFYSYSSFTKGMGHCIHTYMGDGNPLPSFEIHPYAVWLENNIEQNVSCFWDALDKENRVSLLVKHINVKTGTSRIQIINRFTD